MIPLRLTLKNFLSYGPAEQSINFESYSLMCLSGRNGHGKSAILDAITWAIWGCARKMLGLAKGDDGLVHLGQKEMVVHLEFSAGGQRYRIRREFFKSYGKPVTRLDVELFDSNLGHYITLTDKTIRATQEKIESIVGLDFATFVSTSFLRQGQSNEFSKKTPRERKEIIASIIGLAAFDTKAACALEKSKEVGLKIQQIQFSVDQLTKTASELGLVEQEISGVVATAEELDADLQRVAKEQEVWGMRAQQVDVLRRDAARCAQEIEKLVVGERDALQHISGSVRSWRTLHAKIIAMPSVDDLLSERTGLVKRLDVLIGAEKQQNLALSVQERVGKEILAVQVELRHEFELKKADILRRRNEVATSQKYLLAQVADIQNRQKHLAGQLSEIAAQRIVIINQLAQRVESEMKYDQGKKLFEKRKAFYHACVSKRSMAASQLQEIEERKEIVGHVESPVCPLCEQLLTLKRKQFLLHQLTKHERFARHSLDRAASVLKLLETALKAQRSQLEIEARLCSSFQSLEQDLDRMNRNVAGVEVELQNLALLFEDACLQRKKLDQLVIEIDAEASTCDKLFDEALRLDERIVRKQQELAATMAAASSIVYDGNEHAMCARRLTEVDGLLHDARQRTALFDEYVRLRHAVRQLSFDIKRIRQDLVSKRAEKVALDENFVSDDRSCAVVRELEAKRVVLAKTRQECSQRFGSLVERKERCLQAQVQSAQAAVEIDELMTEKKEYEILVDAYGKNGIQALLIEEVLPEVEHEANALLARLTDNQMQIFIESLRDLKSGGVRETLDIQISDGVGIRPYEMFSGGEAFRIDFALRIAVSKLLARRAGTHLQTLFIDEGFGSQDEEGLARLTQALFAVQSDFEKIIIVSHLERLKENFPVHIIVEKKSNGSVIHVEERG